MHVPPIHRPIWMPVEAPPGYAIEVDTSGPHGALRHRFLPDGEWREGNVPADPTLEEIVGPSIAIEGDNWTGAAREFIQDMDAQIKAIDRASDAPNGSADR